LLITSTILAHAYLDLDPPKTEPTGLYVGVDIAYDDMTKIKTVINQVSPYTNVFVIGCTGITYNTTRLNETCQYLYDHGLSFIVYRDLSLRNATWLQQAKASWGNRFLGYYACDELGGYQLDMMDLRSVHAADNYSDAATIFHNMTSLLLNRFSQLQKVTDFNLYTSDYGLYWFDYDTGYDTVFAQFGWNYSRLLNIIQCRGAANIHGKDWSAIITWTYTQPP
jgi:hypothetical protein